MNITTYFFKLWLERVFTKDTLKMYFDAYAIDGRFEDFDQIALEAALALSKD